jgi:hypothetical protein
MRLNLTLLGGIVKKLLVQKRILSFLLGFGSLLGPSAIFAAEADACSKELLLSYFPANFVSEVLKKNNISQDQIDAIVKDLAAKEKDVIKQVEEKAESLNPNPLKDRSPDQRQVTVKIFREALLGVFSSVLKAHGVTDDQQIQTMLADIQRLKAKNFAHCMEKQREQFAKEKANQATPQSQPNPDGNDSVVPDSSSNSKGNYLSDGDEDNEESQDQKDAPVKTPKKDNAYFSDADEDNDNDESEGHEDEDDSVKKTKKNDSKQWRSSW